MKGKRPHPGVLFEHLLPIRNDFRKERVMFSNTKPLYLGFFSLEAAWMSAAHDHVSKEKRITSYPEFSDFFEETPFSKKFSGAYVEMISSGFSSILLVNTCPIAQIDFRAELGIAEFLELPAMSKEMWDQWELLGGSTTSFEIVENSEQLILRQIKKEEGMLNVLEMTWEINLSNGDSVLSVASERHNLDIDPTLENLMDWIEVRSGQAHPSVLNAYKS